MSTYHQKVLEGRKQFLRLTLEQESELLRIYEESSKQIILRLTRVKPKSLSERYLTEIDKALKVYINELRQELSKSIESGIQSSAEIAANVQLNYFDVLEPRVDVKSTFVKMFTQLPTNISKQIIGSNYYSDGKTLNTRIWELTSRNSRDIEQLIRVNIAKGVKAGDLAKELEEYINPVERISTKTRVPGINKSIAYQAQRLSRTSLTHAHNETYIQGSKMNPFCLGLKWNLSPSHYERQVKRWGEDICDEYSGKTFKSDEYPVAHPNCLCYPTQEVKPINDARNELIAWINGEANEKLDKWVIEYGSEYGIAV